MIVAYGLQAPIAPDGERIGLPSSVRARSAAAWHGGGT
jgi:hypothetical protein